MCRRNPQSCVIGLLHFSSEDGFEMSFFRCSFFAPVTRIFFFNLNIGRVLFFSHSFSGPTLIHAPRPRPITYSIGFGTSEFGSDHVDVSTQGGPPHLDFSSFLQDLSLTGMSSPVMRAPVPVLSLVLRRSLTVASPPPVRVTLCQGTSTRDELEYVDMATDTGIINVDKAVQAVVEHCDVDTVYDPPAETTPIVSAFEDAVPDLDFVVTGPTSLTCLESLVDPPDDFTVDSSLAARSESGDAGPASATGPEETSPIGPSLIDSDDDLIASCLPGYLNSFKTCEVSALQFLSYVFLFFCH